MNTTGRGPGDEPRGDKPELPEAWKIPPDPNHDAAWQRPQEPRQSAMQGCLKALGVMALGVLILFGLLLGTCFLLVHK